MRVNVLQHTPNEGVGYIGEWAKERGHEVYIYHPYMNDGVLPLAEETDMLVILGGPMNPDDEMPWIQSERQLILVLMAQNKPIYGACFGAQQISKALGYAVLKSPVKEVGWDDVYLESESIPNIPSRLKALHWHEDMFQIPQQAELLFSGNHIRNQGFIIDHHVIGLQFHFEPGPDDVREIVLNDAQYINHSILEQSAEDILAFEVPKQNRQAIFRILDFITQA
ncbi:TPA: type 1 glutamine amidotransferase [Staphylococcus aureus]|nr:type 1 glutamine amidotransferase [Staphylococcus aureus]